MIDIANMTPEQAQAAIPAAENQFAGTLFVLIILAGPIGFALAWCFDKASKPHER